MKHPNEIIPRQLIAQLRAAALETEAAKSLPPETLAIIYKERWLQVLVPQASGGLEYSLPRAVALFEALAYADANVGWCVNLGAGANMFAGYLEQSVSRAIFDHAETCCAGSGAVTGKALKVAGGYSLTGRWKYASGANHATHFTANAYLLTEEGQPITENGKPVFRSFIIPAAHIVNHRNWDAIGLKATSSNDFEATAVFVPEAHTFSLLQPSGFATGTVYQFPFALLAEIDMVCMLTGIALHFEEAYQALAATKKPLYADAVLQENTQAQAIFTTVAARFHQARNNMYSQLEAVWACYEKGAVPDAAAITAFNEANREATAASRQLIADLFPLCGLNIVSPTAYMNKIWRDAAVAGQHYLLSPLYYSK